MILQSTKLTRPPTPLVQRWRDDSHSSEQHTLKDSNNQSTTTTRGYAQALYDTFGGDVNNEEDDQEASSLLYPTIKATTTNDMDIHATGAGNNKTSKNNVYPNYFSSTHPPPVMKYTNTTTTAPTIHKPPAPTPAAVPVPDPQAFSDSEPDADGDGDTSSEVRAILSEGAAQRLGLPLYVSSPDTSGVDEKGGIEEDIRADERANVSGEKGEYKQAYYGDAYADTSEGPGNSYYTGVGSSRRDTPIPTTATTNTSHRYSTSLPCPPTHTSGKATTSPVHTAGTGIAATVDDRASKPIEIDTQAARTGTGSGAGSGATRTRSSSHASANVVASASVSAGVGLRAAAGAGTAQQQERAERQKQEEAAVVSSYFTCFCEHDREQEQDQEQTGR